MGSRRCESRHTAPPVGQQRRGFRPSCWRHRKLRHMSTTVPRCSPRCQSGIPVRRRPPDLDVRLLQPCRGECGFVLKQQPELLPSRLHLSKLKLKLLLLLLLLENWTLPQARSCMPTDRSALARRERVACQAQHCFQQPSQAAAVQCRLFLAGVGVDSALHSPRHCVWASSHARSHPLCGAQSPSPQITLTFSPTSPLRLRGNLQSSQPYSIPDPVIARSVDK
ncbi:hypothetical protein P154DRAFT_49131 [Amniculicola lignicola CBS 123094]|uniref:Uncharacterized protein n=1 Tax=Amniculicola lignicola CBS 123094 TaxID=1392246 RepID=A0A6A5VVT3_9PLEO|nr:hypothetical protein P154DRAFT_49131 [Amniculicola lignicola CBS 123094]